MYIPVQLAVLWPMFCDLFPGMVLSVALSPTYEAQNAVVLLAQDPITILIVYYTHYYEVRLHCKMSL